MAQRRRFLAVFFSVAVALFLPATYIQGALAAGSTSVQDFAQCDNGAPPSTATNCSGGWINGILNASNSHYSEDDVVPQRLDLAVSGSTTHTVLIAYDAKKGGVHAYDSLATWNFTQTTADRCQGLDPTCDGTLNATSTTFPIPADPTTEPPCTSPCTSAVVSAHQLPGQVMTMFGGTITGVSVPTHSSATGSNDTATVTVTYTVPTTASTDVQLLFGGHVAAAFGPRGWGAGNGAGSISGGPYHLMISSADGSSVGSRDNQIQSGAVIPPALTITKTADAASVNAGQQVGFVITVSNPSTAGIARNAVVTDTLPDNSGLSWSLTPANTPTGCSISSATPEVLTCDFATVAPGTTITIHIVSPTTGSSCGAVSNSATVSADNNALVQSALVTTTVNCAQIGVTKTADATSVSAGSTIGFTVTVSNTGAGTATGVTLTDALPGGNAATPVHWVIDTTKGNPTSFTITGADGSQQLTLAGQPVSMAANTSLTVHVTAATSATSCATYNNTASVSTTNDGSGSQSASEQVLCPSISVTKTADAASVSAGTPIGFTVTVSNGGPGTATGVTLSDPLPGGNAAMPVTWAIDTTTGNPTSFSIAGSAGNQSLILAGQPITLASGASLTVHVTAATAATSCTSYDNTATLGATNDPTSPQQASASESVLCATITVTKTADAASVSAGGTIGFTVTVSNTGAGTATGVTLTDALPGGNSGSPVHWSIDTSKGNPSAFSITGADGSQQLILAGQPTTLAGNTSVSVHVTAPTTATSCTTYSNTASVTTTNDGHGSQSASEQVLCPSIQVTKTADASSVSAGSPIGFTVTVSNSGPGTATGVTLSDALPGGNTATPVDWTIDTSKGNPSSFAITGADGSQSLSLVPATLASGASLSVHVTAATTSVDCAEYDNTAILSADNDPTSPQQASATETVLCPSIHVTKTADAASVSAGSPIGFTVTVSNSGAGDATGVTLSDALPGGNTATPVTWTIDTSTGNPSSFSITGNAGSQSLILAGQPVTLAANSSLTVHVTAQTSASSCTEYDNTATLSAGNDGSDMASASETVLCAHITVTKTADAQSVSAGSPIGFTVTVANTEAGTATGVTLTDGLPGGNAGSPVTWSIDASTLNPSAFVITHNPGSQSLTLASSTLAGNTSEAVHITAQTSATSCTEYDNTATVTTGNDGGGTASASEQVLCPTIDVTKTADAASVSAGSPIGFTVTVSNTGAGTATGVTLSDALPGGNAATPVDWTIDGTTGNPASFAITGPDGSQQLTLAGQPISLTAGAGLTVHIVAATTSTSCATYDNTATLSATNDSTSPQQASASEPVNCPSTQVTKTADAATVSAGSPIGFTVTVSNTGAGDATGFSLSDALPGGNAATPVVWVIDGTTGNPTAFAVTGAPGSQQLTLVNQPVTLTAGTSLTVHVTAVTASTSCATYDNTASISSTNDGPDMASATEQVLCPTIGVTKTADAASVSAGSPIGFTVAVSNAGPGDATGVTLGDALPGGNAATPVDWTIDGSMGNPTDFAITGPDGSQELTLAGQPITLAAGTTLTVHVTAATTSADCTNYDNSATLSATNDPTSPVSAQASETVLCGVLEVDKTSDAASVAAGAPIGFTVTVKNTGQGDATGVTLTDPLPAGNAATPVTWSIDTTTGNFASFVISGPVGSQALTLAGQPILLTAGTTLTVHVTAATTSTSCATYDNTATVDTTNIGSGSAGASEAVLCPSIHVTKTADAASVTAGTPIGFTVTVGNTGQGDATGVTLSDALPGGNAATPVHWTIDTTTGDPADFSISGADGSQQLLLAGQPITLTAGTTLTVHVTATTASTSCATYDNTASAGATNDGGDQMSASETITCPTPITLSKTADDDHVDSGDRIGYTITVGNPNSVPVSDVVVTDDLPAKDGLHWSMDPTVTGCAITGSTGHQNLNCTFSTLGAGDSIGIHIVSKTTDDTCGTVANTATATDAGGDRVSAGPVKIEVSCPEEQEGGGGEQSGGGQSGGGQSHGGQPTPTPTPAPVPMPAPTPTNPPRIAPIRALSTAPETGVGLGPAYGLGALLAGLVFLAGVWFGGRHEDR